MMQLLLIVILSFKLSNSAGVNEFDYQQKGRNWPGLCVAGTQQSPINIIESFNTEDDPDSVLEFDYSMTEDFASK